MKFKTDENLPIEMASLLRSLGYDAMTVGDENLVGASDDTILARCREEGRVLMTLDLDFADVRAYPPQESRGLMVFRVRRQDKTYLVEMLRRVIPLLLQEALDGRLWIVEENRVRIRGPEET